MDKLFRILKILFSKSLYQELLKLFTFYTYEHILPVSKINKKNNVSIHPTVSIRFPENIFLESDVIISANCYLWASKNSKIHIGKNTGIAHGSTIISSNHAFFMESSYTDQPLVEKDIIIKNNVWIGANCVILAGVTIEHGSIIGAGTTVTNDIPEFSIAVPNSRELTILKRR